jgi:hypothetical protein
MAIVTFLNRCLSLQGMLDQSRIEHPYRPLCMKMSNMKRLTFTFVFMALLLCSCSNKADVAQSSDAQTEDTLKTITAEMAYEGVNNYCHKEYDWSVAENNPDIMYVQMGEERDSAFQVVFRSYTGAFVHFYVNKTSGTTRMVEEVPSLNVEVDAGTIDLFEYLVKKN